MNPSTTAHPNSKATPARPTKLTSVFKSNKFSTALFNHHNRSPSASSSSITSTPQSPPPSLSVHIPSLTVEPLSTHHHRQRRRPTSPVHSTNTRDSFLDQLNRAHPEPFKLCPAPPGRRVHTDPTPATTTTTIPEEEGEEAIDNEQQQNRAWCSSKPTRPTFATASSEPSLSPRAHSYLKPLYLGHQPRLGRTTPPTLLPSGPITPQALTSLAALRHRHSEPALQRNDDFAATTPEESRQRTLDVLEGRSPARPKLRTTSSNPSVFAPSAMSRFSDSVASDTTDTDEEEEEEEPDAAQQNPAQDAFCAACGHSLHASTLPPSPASDLTTPTSLGSSSRMARRESHDDDDQQSLACCPLRRVKSHDSTRFSHMARTVAQMADDDDEDNKDPLLLSCADLHRGRQHPYAAARVTSTTTAVRHQQEAQHTAAAVAELERKVQCLQWALRREQQEVHFLRLTLQPGSSSDNNNSNTIINSAA